MNVPLDKEKIRAHTPGITKSTHLAAAGSSLMPQSVVETIISHTLLEADIGGYTAQARVKSDLERVYELLAKHIGAQSHEIALLENASTAWSHAFYALPLEPNTRILTCEAEYAANYVAILQRAKRDNLRIEVIPSDANGLIDLTALESTLGDDVGLIAITWIPTNGGLVNPAAEVGKIARKHGVPYLLDACQAVGQMKIDVQEIGCDFLSATGRKFLRAPRGTGFLYVRNMWLNTLEPLMIDLNGASWVAHDKYEIRPDARRFETWESSQALRLGLGEAIRYVDEVGIQSIQNEVRHLAQFCRNLLSENNAIEVHDLGVEKCGIVCFSAPGADPNQIVQQMLESDIVIGAILPSSTRLDAERRNLPTLMRIAPHYYNTEEEIARAVAHLNTLLK